MVQADEALVDWFRIFADLQKHGLNLYSVSIVIDTPRSTLIGWKNLNVDPKHSSGERLIKFWCKVTQKSRDQLPFVSRYSYKK